MDELTPSWFLHVDWTGAETSRRAVAERFELKAPIGRGGSAEVWHAHDPSTGRDVAIKVLVHEVAREPSHQALLRHEARAVSRLSHPRIVRVLDVGTLGQEVERATDGRIVAGSPFIAMELLRGGTLLPMVADAPPWEVVRGILESVLSALVHAHARGVVHLDVKPSNLLRCGVDEGEDDVALTDFGIAQIFREGGHRGGTMAYAAPEQLIGDGRDVGPRSDLFALGCVGWELLTGATPFALGSATTRAFAQPSEFEPRQDLPAGVEAWLRRLLASAPLQRTASAALALRELRNLSSPHRAARHVASIPTSWRDGERSTTRAQLDFGLGLFGLGRVPFVGREAERDALWSLARGFLEGNRATAEIVGPKGSGTSRLADWLVTQLAEHDAATVIRVSAEEELRDALTRYFAVEGLPAYRTERRILAEAGSHWSVAAAAAVLAGEQEDTSALLALVERLAQQRPLVLWMEEHALPVLQGRVFAIRTGETSLGFGETIRLGPLSRSARKALLRDALGLGAGPQKALQRLSYPGEIIAVVGSWIEAGLLRREQREVVFAAHPKNESEPWRLRLEGLARRLSEGEVRALEVAAVLGSGSEVAVWSLAAAKANTTPTLASLDRLVTEGLGRVAHRTIVFENDFVRDALVKRAASWRLEGYHLACAQALSELSGVRRAKERQGRHLYYAGRYRDALPALEDGARARLFALDPRGALSLLDLHEASLAEAAASEASAVQAAILRAASLRRLGDADAPEAIKAAHRRARALGDRRLVAEAAHQRGRSVRSDDPARAMRYFLEAAEAAKEAEETELASDIAADLVVVLTSLTLFDRAEAMLTQAHAEESRAAGSAMLELLGARVARGAGELDLARARIERATEAFATHQPRMLIEAWAEGAEIERAAGNHQAAVPLYQKALEGRVVLGAAAASVQLHLGLVLVELGDWEGASTHLRGAIAAWSAEGRTDRAKGWTLALAWAAAKAGDWPESVRLIQESGSLPDETWVELHERLTRAATEHPDALHGLGRLAP
ncbi:MAG: protein kinase [Myxococcota bacterium]